MSRSWKEMLSSAEFRSKASTLGTLAMLIAIGYLGHRTHWTIPGFGGHGHSDHGKDSKSDHGPAPVKVQPAGLEKPAAETTTVVFRSPEAVQKSGINVTKAEVRPLKLEVAASGMVNYDQRSIARLSSRVPGTVWRVEKHWGDEVKKGDVLALIDAAEVGRLKSDFARALVDKQLKESIVARLQMSGDGVPMRQLLEATAGLRAARINLLSTEQALINLGFAITAVDYEKLSEDDVMKRLRLLGLSPEVLKTMDPAMTTSNLLPVVSPFNGLVIGRDVGLGETVDSDRPFFEVADVSEMWILLDIRKEDADEIAIGQQVEFMADGIDQPLKGPISWISTEVNEKSRTLQARVVVDNPPRDANQPRGPGNRLLRANMFGRGTVMVRERTQSIALPTSCLQTDGDGLLVFVQTGDQTFEGRRVERGIVQGAFAEVIGPIKAGEFVATQGSHILKSEIALARLRSTQ